MKAVPNTKWSEGRKAKAAKDKSAHDIAIKISVKVWDYKEAGMIL